MSDDLTQSVLKNIAETQHLELETVSIDSSFEELGIDSLDGINILFALEMDFDISIPDEAAKEIRTVRQMVEGVANLVADKAAAESTS